MDSNTKEKTISRMSKPKKVLLVILIVILVLLAAVGIAVLVILNSGRSSLQQVDNPRIDKMALEEAKTVYYNGKDYEYNSDLINILLIGNDCKYTVPERRESPLFLQVANADAFFLITIDTREKKVSGISINRYTMTNIDIWDVRDNTYIESYEAQLGIQYEVGKGLEDSSELQANAVSRVMRNIPINGYVSLSMSAIRSLNNAVGGVELVALDNIPPTGYYSWDDGDYGIGDSMLDIKGKSIYLSDDQAYAYLRYRNIDEDGSADKRLERQRQYIKALVKKIIDKTKSDLTFPLKIRDSLSDYMVTDINDTELIFLASTLLGYKLDLENMGYLPGTLQIGKEYEEYIIDDEALQEMIINKFYKPIG